MHSKKISLNLFKNHYKHVNDLKNKTKYIFKTIAINVAAKFGDEVDKFIALIFFDF